ncbi:MAG TPA: NADP-dependent oxidoreductase [Thermoanaerobaculia bacterium]|nr:NADP-dependent oxidoreductase [Thermoanaerobaculia bacterium]
MTTMRAAAIDRFGGPEVLTIHELPVPKISAQEVLVAIDTAGVGMWDVRVRAGKWAEREEFPMILGTDASGVIAESGAQVKRLKRGDRVYAYSYGNAKGGFYAGYVAVAASKVAPIPRTLDMLPAGGLATIGLTALQGVDDTLQIKPGENVIIHGASGNVGMLALQFAKLRGARVLATATGSDGLDLVRRLGADRSVDGKKDEIVEAAREFAPQGVDAVLAFVGGKALTQCLDALRKGGRAAYPNGVEPEPRKRKGVRIKSYDGTPGVREFERLNRAVEEAELQVPIAAGFKLEEACDAHRMMERGHIIGKVVLRVNVKG